MNIKIRKVIVFLLLFLLVFGNSLTSIAIITENPVEKEEEQIKEPEPVKDDAPKLKEEIIENPPGGDDGGDLGELCHVIKLKKVMSNEEAAALAAIGITTFEFKIYKGEIHFRTVHVPINGSYVALPDYNGVYTVVETIPSKLSVAGLQMTEARSGDRTFDILEGNKFNVHVPSGHTTIEVKNEFLVCPVTFQKFIDGALPNGFDGEFIIDLTDGPEGDYVIVLNKANGFTETVEIVHGDYTISERSMPTVDHEFVNFDGNGITFDDPDYFLEVNANSEGTTITVNNDKVPKGKITVYKYVTNARGSSSEEKFKIELTQIQGQIYGPEDITTISEQKFEQLEMGFYSLKELTDVLDLPDGYTLTKIVEGTVDNDLEANNATEFTGLIELTENVPERIFTVINNREPSGSVTVRKLLSQEIEDLRDSDMTKEFEFSLYKDSIDPLNLIGTTTTFAAAVVTGPQFTGLADGTYVLIETTPDAPWSVESYQVLSNTDKYKKGITGNPNNGIEFIIGDYEHSDDEFVEVDEIRVEVTNVREPNGKIIINKAINNADANFEFGIRFDDVGPSGTNWLGSNYGVYEGIPLIIDNLPDGTYYIREFERTGFGFVSYQQVAPVSSVLFTDLNQGIAVEVNENQPVVEVDITNEKLDDPSAGLRIYKKVVYDTGEVILEVSSDTTEFDISVEGGDFLDPDGILRVDLPWFEANLQYEKLNGEGQYELVGYEIIEGEETGYTFVDMYLLDDGVVAHSIVTDFTQRKGYLEELEENDVTEILIVNEVDELFGQVTLTKSVINENGSARTSDSGTFVIGLTGPEEYYREVTLVGNDSETIAELPFGDYTVSEVSRSSGRYSLVSITPETFTVGVQNLVHASTVTNRYTPPDDPPEDDPDPTRLRIYKDVVNNDDAGDFTFILNGPDYDDYEITLGDGDRFSRSVDEGTYTIQELLQDDYSVEVEVDGRTVSVSEDGTVEVDVDEETTVEVRFTNTYEEPEEPETFIEEDVTPQAPPEPIPEPEVEPEIILVEEIPLGIDTLPQTGESDPNIFYAFGSIIAGLGYALKKIKEDR